MNAAFVHLHVHSEYSLADGIVRVSALAAASVGNEFPAVALTDLSNVYGMIKFYRTCLKQNVKPIIGCDIWVENPLVRDRFDRMIVLCCNQQGYQNLSKLLTAAHLRGKRKAKTVIEWSELEAAHNGLLVLFDDQEGPLTARSGLLEEDRAVALIGTYQKLFGDRLYFQISRVGNTGERAYIAQVHALAATHNVGLVATNRVEFIDASEFFAHEIRVCIHEGRTVADRRRVRRFTEQQYLRSTAEMIKLFSDIPEAIENTVEIAQRCNLFINFDENFLPNYPRETHESVDQVLRRQAEAGLCERLGVQQLHGEDSIKEYISRLDMELDVINQMGYPGYFLIVADFIRWSKKNSIPVGPGRGSGAGSLVAWATGITEIDPLHYGLLFERFLNPERISLPDFDIDFCVDGRDRVIEYVAKRYGRDQVAQIITFGTMAAKAVVRDVGRVMEIPYGAVDQIAKLIPFEIGITLQKALKQEELLAQRYREDAEVKNLIDTAMQLEGIARNVGKHAGGVVIAPHPLTEYTPLYAEAPGSQAITQLDKDDLEAIGLVKFDFLGLRTLTIIDSAVKMINQRQGVQSLDMMNIPLDDTDAFDLIQKGRTIAIFQLESRGIRDLIVRLKPDKFNDLVALVALYRPGPLKSGMVDDFINRKHGNEAISYSHPDIAPILEPTYGVILYQEQVMQIAQVLAGYTLGGADLLRAAMGKKKVDEMAKQRKVFMEGAKKRNVDVNVAKNIFDLMEKFAGYGFNKSHSVSYALIAYHTAWLKAHYPADYMAATLSAEMQNTDKLVPLLADCAELGLAIKTPNVNRGCHSFRATNERTILYGIGAIKGVGKAVSEGIEAERENGGQFHDLYDFCMRLNGHTLTKRVLEVLIKSGAMDVVGEHRAALMDNVDNAIRSAEQQQMNQKTGQKDMCGGVETLRTMLPEQPLKPWNEQQILNAEKETLGLYLSGHPYTRYQGELSGVISKDVSELDLSTPKNGAFAGLVIAMRVFNTRRGKMAFVTLDNAIKRIDVSLYSEQYKKYRSSLQKGNVLVAYGEFSADDFNGGVQLRAARVFDIDTFRNEHLRKIELDLYEGKIKDDIMKSLCQVLSQHQGGNVGINIRYYRSQGELGRFKLGADWSIHPCQALFDALAELIGVSNIKFDYETSPVIKGKNKTVANQPKVAVAS